MEIASPFREPSMRKKETSHTQTHAYINSLYYQNYPNSRVRSGAKHMQLSIFSITILSHCRVHSGCTISAPMTTRAMSSARRSIEWAKITSSFPSDPYHRQKRPSTSTLLTPLRRQSRCRGRPALTEVQIRRSKCDTRGTERTRCTLSTQRIRYNLV